MDENRFWQIIEQSRAVCDADSAEGNFDLQAHELERLLGRMTADEVLAFRDIFCTMRAKAYRWDLWGAASLIGGGCSDDSFMDFRSWLISMGERVYTQALQDPDSLADVVAAPDVEDVFFEGYQYVSERVYAALTGSSIPPGTCARDPVSPSGTNLNNDASRLREEFPRLWRTLHSTLRA